MRNGFRIKSYNDSQRPTLRYVVNFKKEGRRSRRFFVTKREAETFIDQKKVEMLNGGNEAAQFPTALRVMRGEAAQLLTPYGKTILDAVNFYLPHLKAANPRESTARRRVLRCVGLAVLKRLRSKA